MPKRKLLPKFLFGILLCGVTLLGIELLAWIFTPAWPGYVLRPLPISHASVARWNSGMPDVVFATNSWLMRDRERSLAKPQGVAFRSIFIGDSFLEGGFTRAPLPARIEGMLVGKGQEDVEAVNLGVAGTSPVEYYYRLRDIGLKLSPDAVVMTIYAGNDFGQSSFRDHQGLPPFIAELPRPSLLATVAPHTTWLTVGALGLAGISRGKYVPGEEDFIDETLHRPMPERVAALARHMKEHYFPQLDENTVRDVLARAPESFWSEYKPRRFDREYLQGWILRGLIDWETNGVKLPSTPAEASAEVSAQEIDDTLSWIAAAAELARARGVKFLAALVPVGAVDPSFVEYWRPWPRFYAYTLQSDARHKALAAALARTDIPFIDLRPVLDGVPGAYRKTDMHWTEHGHEVVAARLAGEILKLRR